jgi:hypothetical protein
MPKGLKDTSAIIVISSSVTESAANTFTTAKIDLQLNPLDQEVFVVLAVDIDVQPPSIPLAPGQNVTACSMSTTARTTVAGLDASNVMAAKRLFNELAAPGEVATFEYTSSESPNAMLDYIGIISTNDYFLNIEGAGNVLAKAANVRVWGYRARAESAIYAALVNSEVLSA